MTYQPFQMRGNDPDWQQQFDACLARLRALDEEEARIRREFVADMHGLMGIDPAQVLRRGK